MLGAAGEPALNASVTVWPATVRHTIAFGMSIATRSGTGCVAFTTSSRQSLGLVPGVTVGAVPPEALTTIAPPPTSKNGKSKQTTVTFAVGESTQSRLGAEPRTPLVSSCVDV